MMEGCSGCGLPSKRPHRTHHVGGSAASLSASSLSASLEVNPMKTPAPGSLRRALAALVRSEEHTSELQSLMRISYAVFCLKKKQIRLLLDSAVYDDCNY